VTRTLAIEWAPRGVRVNALAPGWIETDMNARLSEDPERRERMLDQIAMRRFGSPKEVAAAALLCSNAAPYITGTVLVVEGGDASHAGAAP
jgi:NAD(P)-dependent dehydrogenase (short-subunit alcohol dehydrogenase family)